MKRPKYFVGVDISAETFMVAVGEEPWRKAGTIFSDSFARIGYPINMHFTVL